MYLFWSRGDWAKEILKGFFLSCISAFGWELVNFSCLEKLNLMGATSCPATWEHCVLATSLSPSCFCLLSLLQLHSSLFLSSRPRVTVDLFQSVVVIIKDLLCFKKIIFFFISLLKCFYWTPPQSFSLASSAINIWNDEIEHARTISLSPQTVPPGILYFVSM